MELLKSALSQIFEVPADTALSYFIVMMMGVVTNWIWKCKREKIDPIEYWTANPTNSVLAFFGMVATFLTTMMIEPGLGKASYFAIGIACDSMMVKPPLPATVQAALAEAENTIHAQKEMLGTMVQSAGDAGLRDNKTT